MRFIDLFAGLGGFHIALRRLGHTCVFASEIDEDLRTTYEKNFGIKPVGDIRGIKPKEIPTHDILCAGFPCQPYSKAGEQQGFKCPKWGDLIDYILSIISKHKPQYIIFENVANFEKHNGGLTWLKFQVDLEGLGYKVDLKRLSPHHFGIPQIRERVFIVGNRKGLDDFYWPERKLKPSSLVSLLDKNPPDARLLSSQVTQCLEVWQEFLDLFPKDNELPSFPIWSMEFGATYPYEEETPFALGLRKLRYYKGSFGVSLKEFAPGERMEALPAYARTEEAVFPSWKIGFIKRNRQLYQTHKGFIDEWLPKISLFPPSRQKFEWHCKGESRDIWDYVLQLRASGVRVKRPTTSPSLVAMTTTQIPIVAWERRYMTTSECARLQSMQELTHFPSTSARTFKALGNAVNVDLVELIVRALLSGHSEKVDRVNQKFKYVKALV